MTAGAGESWDALVESDGRSRIGRCRVFVRHSSMVGGTPIQNVGAYGQEVSTTIEKVTVYDCADHLVRAPVRPSVASPTA